VGQALREIAAAFGVSWEGSSLEKGMQQVEQAKKGLVVFGGLLLATGYAVARFAAGFEQDAGALQDTAASLDLTTTELQELEVAATRAGLRTEQFRTALQRFQQNAEAAAQGGNAQAKIFEKLGITVKDAGGHVLGTGELLTDLAGAFDKIEDPAKRAAMAHDLFGRQGARIATILHSGAGGIEELRGELELLGGGMSRDGIEVADRLGDEFDRLKVTMNSVRSAIAVVLLPPLTWLAEKTREAMTWLSKLAKETSIVQAALVLLSAAAIAAGGIMLAAFLPVILAMAPWVLGIAAVWLVLDDLITLFRDGDSAIGRFIDSMFGVGAAKEFVHELSAAWEALKSTLDAVSDSLLSVFELFGRKRTVRNEYRSVEEAAQHRFATTDARPTDRGATPRSVDEAQARGMTETSHSMQTLIANATKAGLHITPELRAQLQLVALPSRPTIPAVSTHTTQVVQHNANTFHIDGSGDPRAVAADVVRLTEQRNAAALERAHAARRDVSPPPPRGT
jgi:hypothetical protein